MRIRLVLVNNWEKILGLAAIGAGTYILWGERAFGWVMFIGGILLCFG